MTTKIEERLLQNLSTQECAWVLGRKLGAAAIEEGQHAPAERVRLYFSEASFCAERLSVQVPPLAARTGELKRDGQRALVYLLRSAGGAIADQLAREHSKRHRALFELGVKLQILYWIYQPRFDMALAVCEAIERAVGEAELPVPLWSGLIEKVRSQELSPAVIDRVRAEIRSTERAIWAHLLPRTNSPERATPQTARRKRAWELGQHLSTALVAQAQGEPPEVVRPSFQRAEALAVDLGTSLQPLPAYDPRHPRRGSADAVSYLLRDAGTPLIAHLRAAHGVAHAALFEMSAKAILLRWLYAPGDELGVNLMRIVANNASEAGIMTRIWVDLVRKILSKSAVTSVQSAIDTAMQQSLTQITDKSKGTLAGNNQSITIPFHKEGAGLRVQTTFNGRLTAQMLYDTGASITVIDRAHAQRLGLSMANSWPLQVHTANGLTTWQVVEIDSVEVGGARVEGPFELAISELVVAPDAAGLLGLNFIRAFITSVDYERNTVTFRAR